MKKIIFIVLWFSLNSVGAQEYKIFIFQEKADKIYTKKGNNYLFQFFLKDYNYDKAKKIANLFINERGVENVEFSKVDNNMFKITLTLYQHANTKRYYWFLLKRNHIKHILTPNKTFYIDDYFNIHDKIVLKKVN